MWNETYKEQRKNMTLYILNISQYMFICLESILIIAVRGFISLCVSRPFACGILGITGASEMVLTPSVSRSSVDVPLILNSP
jgi:hypothetical protein